VKESGEREEKHVEVDIMVPTCSPLNLSYPLSLFSSFSSLFTKQPLPPFLASLISSEEEFAL
jgi:hypothetical protein